jgi:hypothetical protein
VKGSVIPMSKYKFVEFVQMYRYFCKRFLVLVEWLTLSIIIDHPHFGGVGLWLGDSNGRRVSHGGHGCGWHHQGRHNTTLLD